MLKLFRVRSTVLGFLLACTTPCAAQSTCPPVPVAPRPDMAFLPCQVTDSLLWRSAQTPTYPRMMMSGAIAGGARLQFTVTSAGRVDTSSIKVLESTHELFVQAARSALSTWRARAARFHGRPVAEVIQYTFLFFPRDTVPCPTHDQLGVFGDATVTCLPDQKKHGPAARTPPGRESSLTTLRSTQLTAPHSASATARRFR